MKLELQRIYSTSEETIGVIKIDGKFKCFTLEDEFRAKKKFGETRIPQGTYEIKLRQSGGMHERYKRKFADLHAGMLELQDVPNFTYIYLHIGNRDEDSAGCILLGSGVIEGNVLVNSTTAYLDVYGEIICKLPKEKVLIEIKDLDLEEKLR